MKLVALSTTHGYGKHLRVDNCYGPFASEEELQEWINQNTRTCDWGLLTVDLDDMPEMEEPDFDRSNL